MDIIYKIKRLEKIYKTAQNPCVAAKLSQLYYELSRTVQSKAEVDYCVTSAILYFKKAFPDVVKNMRFSENPYLAREELSVRLSSFLPELGNTRRASSLGAVAPLK